MNAPRHDGNTLQSGPGLQGAIVKQAGISMEDFLDAL
jgi:hypothetical protein